MGSSWWIKKWIPLNLDWIHMPTHYSIRYIALIMIAFTSASFQGWLRQTFLYKNQLLKVVSDEPRWGNVSRHWSLLFPYSFFLFSFFPSTPTLLFYCFFHSSLPIFSFPINFLSPILCFVSLFFSTLFFWIFHCFCWFSLFPLLMYFELADLGSDCLPGHYSMLMSVELIWTRFPLILSLLMMAFMLWRPNLLRVRTFYWVYT